MGLQVYTEVPKTSSNLIGVGGPRLDAYAGPWAMRSTESLALAQIASSIDIALHLGEQPASRRSPSTPVSRRSPEAADDAAKPFGTRWDEQLTGDGIAVIQVSGVLMKFVSSLTDGTSTVRLREQVRRAAASKNVRGIFLHIDSPGGTVAGTEDLATDIARAARRKPVHAYFEDLTASAALWIGSQASVTSCNATALVGSIGTYMLVYDLSKLAENEGIEPVLIRAGEPYKGAGAPGTEVTQVQRDKWQKDINALNEHFLRGVARGRNLPIERVRELNTGEVWIGQAARQVGLVDHVESIDGAMSRLRQATSSDPQPARSVAVLSAGAEQLDDELASDAPAERIAGGILEQIRQIAATGGSITFARPSQTNPAVIQETVMSKDNQATTAASSSAVVTATPAASDSPAGATQPQQPAAEQPKAPATAPATPAKPAGQDAPAPAAGPVAATLAELKAAFPDDPAFVLSALENGETMQQATARHKDIRLAQLEEENKTLKAQLEAAPKGQAAKPGDKPAAAKPAGVAPVADRNAAASASAGTSSAKAESEKLIAEMMEARGCDRRTAACRVFKDRPDLAEALRSGA